MSNRELTNFYSVIVAVISLYTDNNNGSYLINLQWAGGKAVNLTLWREQAC